MKPKRGDHSELAFAFLRSGGPHPPIDDDPPLGPFMLSLGIMLGRGMGSGALPGEAVRDAGNRIGSQKSVLGIIHLVWGK